MSALPLDHEPPYSIEIQKVHRQMHGQEDSYITPPEFHLRGYNHHPDNKYNHDNLKIQSSHSLVSNKKKVKKFLYDRICILVYSDPVW